MEEEESYDKEWVFETLTIEDSDIYDDEESTLPSTRKIKRDFFSIELWRL